MGFGYPSQNDLWHMKLLRQVVQGGQLQVDE